MISKLHARGAQDRNSSKRFVTLYHTNDSFPDGMRAMLKPVRLGPGRDRVAPRSIETSDSKGWGKPLFAFGDSEVVIHEFFAPAILPSLSCVDHVKEPQPLKGESRIIWSFFPVGMPVSDLV